MGLRELELKRSYDSSIDDVIDDFYVPVLSKARRYDRIAGFFTSSSLAVSSKGILKIAASGGQVRFLVSPKLSEEDAKIINGAVIDPEEYINDVLYKELLDSKADIIENYKLLLAHLIAKGIVEIRVVLIKSHNKYLSAEEIEKSSIFHQKVGIVYDENDDVLSFSGSINESFNAWNENVEEFKTFKSWNEGQSEYCFADVEKFNSFWNGDREKVVVMDFPEAIKQKYIELAETSDFQEIKKRIEYRIRNNTNKKLINSLFWYQREAMQKWKNNNYRLLFAMATGTGKTRTAFACISELMKSERLLIVIATPQSSLSRQWHDEAGKINVIFDKSIICDSSNSYKKTLDEDISKLNLGMINNLALFTTHATASDKKFIEQLKRLKRSKVKMLFVGDEVHGLGSSKQKDALLEEYDYRIGLSATPSRWFDEHGSKLLEEYFGDEKYEFGIERALTETNPLTNQSFLTPYNYFPEFVYLTPEENLKYESYTEKIVKCQGDDEETEERRKKLLQKRAEIIKSAEGKLYKLKEILIERMLRMRIENTIIFTSPKHMRDVLMLLYDLRIMASPLTEQQGTTVSAKYGGMSERQMIIEEFKKKNIQVIVAIKCMDEGIDIPSADTAILMSSTTNPREYIQRIGRVIRRYPGKRFAEIIDLIAKSDDLEISSRIQANEYKRVHYIVELARNAVTAIDKLYM